MINNEDVSRPRKLARRNGAPQPIAAKRSAHWSRQPGNWFNVKGEFLCQSAWNLDSAADAAGCKSEIDQATELLWDEIANDADAVFAVGRSCNGGTADLAPLNGQVGCLRAACPTPTHLHPSMRGRQSAIFCSV